MTLYTIGCPKCDILKKKLDEKGILYSIISDRHTLLNLGFDMLPVLEVNGVFMDFRTANDWIKEQ